MKELKQTEFDKQVEEIGGLMWIILICIIICIFIEKL